MGQLYHVYCDESCTDKGHSYMVIAGIMVSVAVAEQYRDYMRGWRVQANMKNELKWTRVSNGKMSEYQEYIATGMGHIQAKAFSFRSVVISKSELDYSGYHDGDSEKAFRRFIYTLIYNCFCPLLSPGDELVIFLDQRDGACLEELRGILNRTIRMNKRFTSDPIRAAKWIDSKSSEFMQLNDVLMGAVACHTNGRHLLPGTRRAKVELAATIARTAGLCDLSAQTDRSFTHFGIWKMQLKQKRRS